MTTSRIEHSAIDTTLALGADSYLREHGPLGSRAGALDPFGRECLIALIDLVVNSTVCHLILPTDREYLETPAIVKGLPALIRIRNAASVSLADEAEARIVAAFWATVDQLGDNLSRWYRSQALNPIVIKNQTLTSATQAADALKHGLESFRALSTPSEVASRPWLLPDDEHPLSDIDMALTRAERQFKRCAYAYSVFRRAWQYAEATRVAGDGAVYYTHRLRRLAILGVSEAWQPVLVDEYWSWGRCIADIVEATPELDTAMVDDWINGLLEARTPRWIRAPSPTPTGDFDGAQVRAYREVVHECAHKAKLPRVRTTSAGPKDAIGRVLVTEGVDMAIGGPIRMVVRALHAHHLTPFRYEAAETAKTIANLYRKGTFDYPGLPAGSRG